MAILHAHRYCPGTGDTEFLENSRKCLDVNSSYEDIRNELHLCQLIGDHIAFNKPSLKDDQALALFDNIDTKIDIYS